MTNSQLLFESTLIQWQCCSSKCWPRSGAVNKENRAPASAGKGATRRQLPLPLLEGPRQHSPPSLPSAFTDHGTRPPPLAPSGDQRRAVSLSRTSNESARLSPLAGRATPGLRARQRVPLFERLDGPRGSCALASGEGVGSMGFTPGHTRAGHDLSPPLVFLSLAPSPPSHLRARHPTWGPAPPGPGGRWERD